MSLVSSLKLAIASAITPTPGALVILLADTLSYTPSAFADNDVGNAATIPTNSSAIFFAILYVISS